jgi:tRNA G46 methylase TrmB
MPMATLPSSKMAAIQINEANNAHIGSGSEFLRRAMQNRTVAKNVPHLTPILDSLPVSAVVLEVGCGPGGITLDIAKRYPHLEVFGVDIDEASIKVD